MKTIVLCLITAGLATASSLIAGGGFSGTTCYYTNVNNQQVLCTQSAPNLAGKGPAVYSGVGHPAIPNTESCGFFTRDGTNFLCNSGVDLSKTVTE